MSDTRKTFIIYCCVAALAGCGKGDASTDQSGGGKGKGGRGSGGGKLEYPVQVAPVEERTVRYTINAPGSIDAFQQVQITARVSGAVDKVNFKEGQDVKDGEVLANIESERYQVALDAAKATLTKMTAALHSAETALSRRTEADKESPGLIPGEEIETKQTAVETAKADLEAARQSVRVAELNLRDSYVRAPIAGIVQTRTVQTGQYLQPGAVLATILQRDPLLLRFQVTEQEAPRLKTDMVVQFGLKETVRDYLAKITLVSGAADPNTRLVSITATVDDTTHAYWLRPGAFCEVTVPIGDARKAVVVPTLAVQPTEKGNVIYTVDEKAGIAHARRVELGMHTSDGGVEITRLTDDAKVSDAGVQNGFQDGELIVVRGLEPLSEGAPVKIISKTSLSAAQQPDAGVPAADEASSAPAAAESSSGAHKGKHKPGGDQ